MNYYQTQKAIQPSPTQRDYVHIMSFKNGNPRALDEFYLRHQREFLKWSEKVFGLDATEALDVYQDAILILYENIQRGKLNHLSASLKTYFFAIGKNLILKKLARRKSEIKRWQNAIKEEEHTQVSEFDSLHDQEQTRFEAVVSALEGLSERNQSILRLYYYHKLPLKDIAKELGYESVDVVKNQKVRCMKYLRKLMETQMEEVCTY
jgi:RNA polymerase sigma-70 factor (ECF subfamily)